MMPKPKFNKKNINPPKLPYIAEWEIRDIDIFNEHLFNYDSVPYHRKLLRSMIKFGDMYQPITKGGMMVDPFNYIPSANEARRIKRMEIYMNKKDLINSYDYKGGRKIVVTSRGHKIFYRDFPLAKLRKNRWDGYWTIIMYDFPESIASTRNYIRNKLMKLGCGTPQISILASPLNLERPLHELIEGEKLEKYMWTFRAKKILGLTNKEIANKSWPLAQLNRLYSLLLEALPILKKDRDLLDEWARYFLALNNVDPYLPYELLPKDWFGIKCEKEFKKLKTNDLFSIIFKTIKKRGKKRK